jgi:hypothetical protein
MQTHTQVAMQRGTTHDVCWIPSKFAVQGKTLRLVDEDGWVVTSVGDLRLPSEYVEERKNDYRTQRRASDV